ncbi:MAG: hypothetical protein KKG04_08230 [Candidatus Thermoplasmatota archaeon]|nr:hypothetical protein [Candidatus Thermoplasmatota archaeon]
MKPHTMKWFALLGLVLFLGVAAAPSINANSTIDASKENLVEYSTMIYGSSKATQHSVWLTQQEGDEIDQIFDELGQKLDADISKKETISLFKETLYKLDAYGLLGDLTVEQVLAIITKNYRLERNFEFDDNDTNAFCLIAGATTLDWVHTLVLFPIWAFILWPLSVAGIRGQLIAFVLYVIIYQIYFWFQPLSLCRSMELKDNSGWIHTIGNKGTVSWGGDHLNGGITFERFTYAFGIVGFNGIMFGNVKKWQFKYVRSALYVDIDQK